MSDTRTPEQRAADEGLTDAINTVNRAYFGDSDRLLTDYVVVFAEQSWDDDGDPITAVGTNPRDGDMAIYKTIGLLEYGLTRAKQRMAEDAAE